MKKKPVILFGGYELDKTYFNSYWRKKCTVTALHGSGHWSDWSVTVKWEDGRSTTHMTLLDKRDKVVSEMIFN